MAAMDQGDGEDDRDSWDALAQELLDDYHSRARAVNMADAARSESTAAATARFATPAAPAPDLVNTPPKRSHGQTNEGSGGTVTSPFANFRTSSWWAQLLKRHAKSMGLQDPHQPGSGCPCIKIVSGCSGIFAEGEALKASKLQ